MILQNCSLLNIFSSQRAAKKETIMEYKLIDIASVIRSKNSGPYELTFDIIFKDVEMYKKSKRGKSN